MKTHIAHPQGKNWLSSSPPGGPGWGKYSTRSIVGPGQNVGQKAAWKKGFVFQSARTASCIVFLLTSVVKAPLPPELEKARSRAQELSAPPRLLPRWGPQKSPPQTPTPAPRVAKPKRRHLAKTPPTPTPPPSASPRGAPPGRRRLGPPSPASPPPSPPGARPRGPSGWRPTPGAGS